MRENNLLIVDCLQQITAVALAEIELSGILRHANAGFFHLLPPAIAHTPGINVLDYFISPVFSEWVNNKDAASHLIYEGLLTIGNPNRKTRTLRGRVFRCSDVILLVAEYNIEELEQINNAAIELSNDLAQAQREIITTNSQLRLREDEIRKLSMTDQLTGIANRRKLDETLDVEISHVRRYGGDLSIAMADLDQFKAINDGYGHAVGDLVLQAFATTVKSQIRETDLIARYGGEEFMIIMPHCGLSNAGVCVERIRKAVVGMIIPPLTRPVTASFGITCYRTDDTLDILLKRVDNALYQVKTDGGNKAICV